MHRSIRINELRAAISFVIGGVSLMMSVVGVLTDLGLLPIGLTTLGGICLLWWGWFWIKRDIKTTYLKKKQEGVK